jgi:SAM-dependent methyltransferase
VSGTLTATEAVIWHEVECGGYADDLDLWAELAERHGGAVLDLGCGTGRDLATLTPQFTGTGIDIQPGLIDYGRRTGLHHGDPHQLPDHRAPHHAGHRLVPVQQVLT